MNTRDKILKGIALKEQGNDHFSRGELNQSLRCYHEAICYLKGLDSGKFESFAVDKMANDEKEVVNSELQKIKSNMSAVYLKTQKYHKVLELLSNVSDNDAKGLYRRGMAFKELKMLDKSLQDLKKAALLLPMDKGIRSSLELVMEELKLQEQVYNKTLKDKLEGTF